MKKYLIGAAIGGGLAYLAHRTSLKMCKAAGTLVGGMESEFMQSMDSVYGKDVKPSKKHKAPDLRVVK